jgi:hypothetical protein
VFPFPFRFFFQTLAILAQLQGIKLHQKVAGLAETHLFFRLSFNDYILDALELEYGGNFFLGMRVLYSFLQPDRTINSGYAKFLDMYVIFIYFASLTPLVLLLLFFRHGKALKALRLVDVLEFIGNFFDEPSELLVILHLDETQRILYQQQKEHLAFFVSILDAIYTCFMTAV